MNCVDYGLRESILDKDNDLFVTGKNTPNSAKYIFKITYKGETICN